MISFDDKEMAEFLATVESSRLVRKLKYHGLDLESIEVGFLLQVMRAFSAKGLSGPETTALVSAAVEFCEVVGAEFLARLGAVQLGATMKTSKGDA